MLWSVLCDDLGNAFSPLSGISGYRTQISAKQHL